MYIPPPDGAKNGENRPHNRGETAEPKRKITPGSGKKIRLPNVKSKKRAKTAKKAKAEGQNLRY